MARNVEKPENYFERVSMFLPIKLVNGFISCDFIIGCYCCKFCLNRRYADWNQMLNTGKVFHNSITPELAVKYLSGLKSFTEGKVTLKFGHDTDMSLEEEKAQDTFKLLPMYYPVVFMRRGKLLDQFKDFYMKNYDNLLVCLTITPRSRFLEYYNDPYEIIDSFRDIKSSIFYTVGPVSQDNLDEAKRIIDYLPARSYMIVRELILKDIPNYPNDKNIVSCEKLREYANSKGFNVMSYLNCLVRSKLGLPFHKHGEFISEPNVWQNKWCGVCDSRNLCGESLTDDEEKNKIFKILKELNLTLESEIQKKYYKTYLVNVNEDVSFGDESYIREKACLKVDLFKKGRKTGSTLSKNIYERWNKVGFFPIEDLYKEAEEIFGRIGLTL
jgi:hypothetical protein